jgi:hypothetical protein
VLRGENGYDQIKILGAAAVLSLMLPTPVFAQAAIREPGAFTFAFAYPNNDVLNGGPRGINADQSLSGRMPNRPARQQEHLE